MNGITQNPKTPHPNTPKPQNPKTPKHEGVWEYILEKNIQKILILSGVLGWGVFGFWVIPFIYFVLFTLFSYLPENI
jgi:hypothetical protein